MVGSEVAGSGPPGERIKGCFCSHQLPDRTMVAISAPAACGAQGVLVLEG